VSEYFATPLGFLVLCLAGLAALMVLVGLGLRFQARADRREADGPPDAHGDVPRIPSGARWGAFSKSGRLISTDVDSVPNVLPPTRPR
jgi:hypothetical protein